MNIMFVLHTNNAFSDVLEGMASKIFSLALLACLTTSFFYVNDILNL